MHYTTSTNDILNIKVNGTHHASIIYTGDLGAATVTLMCHGVALTDGVLVANSQTKVEHGQGAPIQAVVTGITTPISFFLYTME